MAWGQILPFPIGFRRLPYNTLALPCQCVLTSLVAFCCNAIRETVGIVHVQKFANSGLRSSNNKRNMTSDQALTTTPIVYFPLYLLTRQDSGTEASVTTNKDDEVYPYKANERNTMTSGYAMWFTAGGCNPHRSL